MNFKNKGFLTCLLLAMLVGACAKEAPKLEPEDKRAPAEIYADAQKKYEDADYNEAIKLYKTIERQYPYAEESRDSILDIAQSYYQLKKYAQAQAYAQRFINTHPGNKRIALAHFVIALSNYDQISDDRRDAEKADKTKKAFERLISFFPDSKYARDAKYKLRLIDDILAAKEMEIGRFYLNKKSYIAAMNRFKAVVKNYPKTKHVEEALHRLTECYIALGITIEAQSAAALLGYNYPRSPWYTKSYDLLAQHNLLPKNEEKSWTSKNFQSNSKK